MRWLQNIAFSYFPSSSSTTNQTSTALIDDRSSAYSSRSTRNNNKNNNSNNNNNNNSIHNRVNRSKDRNNINKDLPGPRLTRQKKLRHLSDQEVIGAAKFSPPLFSDSVGLSRSQSSYDNFSSPSSSSAFKSSPSTATAHPMPLPLPLPLPLPEENGELRLRSPKETAGLGRVVEEREKEKERDGFRDRDRVDGAAEEVPSSSSPIASVFPNRVSMNNKPEYLEKNSSRNVYQSDRNSLESSREKFKMDIPFQSAPSSPFGSPVVSPQGMNVSEMFQYNCSVSKGHKVWSAPEMPILDAPGLPPPAFFDYTAISADNSPFHSPRSRSPCRTPISPNGSSSPINSKLSRQNTGHIEVHPLPLPPGAAIPSPSSPISQVPAKPESLRMKSQWQKGKLIGRGTFGSVYVASNRETGALCAMKEVDMFPDDPKSAESIKQLEQEIKVLSNLKHPNIVQYYGSEIVEDKFYIYLEYVHPGSINKYVREHCGTMTESIVRNFTRHILSGLTYLHSKKTIHRDIKGANLLVDASGVVKLADFGMAKHLNGQVADLSLKGSPYWMAPELMISVMQRDNTSDLALAVDIWSLGCTIIEMYTGKPPWSEFEGAAAMFKVMKDTPSIPECLSAEGKDFLRCCFQRNPAERPSASKLLEHRFLKNSQQPDVPSWTMAFSGMNLTDRPHSPRQQSESKVDQLPVSPSPSTRKEFESERQQSLREASHITFVSHFSPRSTLEALPSASPPRSAHHAHHPSPYALTLGLTSIGAKNGTPR